MSPSALPRAGHLYVIVLLCSQATPTAALRLPALALLAMVALLNLAGTRRLGSVRLPLAVLLLNALAFGSLTWSINLSSTAQGVAQLALLSVCAMYLAVTRTLADLHRGVELGCQAIIAASILAEFTVRPFPASNSSGAAQGVFSNPNPLAFVCVVGFFAFITSPRKRMPAKVVWGSASVALLIATLSDGGLIYLLISVAALVAIAAAGRSRPVGRTVLLLAGAVAVLSLFTERVQATLLELAGIRENPTLTGRTDLWGAAWSAIQQRPLHGYGWNALTDRSVLVDRHVNALWYRGDYGNFNPHNGFLDVTLQVGGVGLLLLVALVATTVTRGMRSYAREPRREVLWMTTTGIAIAVYNMTESRATLNLPIALLLVLTLAIAAHQLTIAEAVPKRESGRKHGPVTTVRGTTRSARGRAGHRR